MPAPGTEKKEKPSGLSTRGAVLVGVGIALILGAFTGIAAFFGALMNWNFMLAGSASTNPVLFLVALGLIMAWKVAGYIGADYFLLPWIGTPWTRRSDKIPDESFQTRS